MVNALRFIVWSALSLLRGPFRLLFTLMSWSSLAMFLAGLVTLPFGGIADTPLWAHVFVTVASGAFFYMWSALSHGYDSLIFRLTPEDREIFLEG